MSFLIKFQGFLAYSRSLFFSESVLSISYIFSQSAICPVMLLMKLNAYGCQGHHFLFKSKKILLPSPGSGWLSGSLHILYKTMLRSTVILSESLPYRMTVVLKFQCVSKPHGVRSRLSNFYKLFREADAKSKGHMWTNLGACRMG